MPPLALRIVPLAPAAALALVRYLPDGLVVAGSGTSFSSEHRHLLIRYVVNVRALRGSKVVEVGLPSRTVLTRVSKGW